VPSDPPLGSFQRWRTFEAAAPPVRDHWSSQDDRFGLWIQSGNSDHQGWRSALLAVDI